MNFPAGTDQAFGTTDRGSVINCIRIVFVAFRHAEQDMDMIFLCELAYLLCGWTGNGLGKPSVHPLFLWKVFRFRIISGQTGFRKDYDLRSFQSSRFCVFQNPLQIHFLISPDRCKIDNCHIENVFYIGAHGYPSDLFLPEIRMQKTTSIQKARKSSDTACPVMEKEPPSA